MSEPIDSSQILKTIQKVADERHIPAATYRLQFNADFTFSDAQKLIPYLDDLGVNDVYASPIFLPRAGSTHGYDVADPTRFNSDLGSEEDFDALAAALHKRGMGLVLDIVPNHMGVNDARNGWWLDVLENGPSSQYAAYFDIQWQPIKHEMANKVLLPILGDQYGVILERGELRLNYAAGSFYITYWETMLPLSPRSYISILRHALEQMPEVVEGGESEKGAAEVEPSSDDDIPLPSSSMLTAPTVNLARMELESIITALSYLPARTERDPERMAERVREKEIAKRRLDVLHTESAEFRHALEAAVAAFNGTVGDSASFDLLDALIDGQAYRLAFWRVAGEEINYRRFFDINELAAIRVEEAEVFTTTHALALRLLAEGKANGLRIDHPDGLYDPVTYFIRLQQHYLTRKVREELGDALDGMHSGDADNAGIERGEASLEAEGEPGAESAAVDPITAAIDAWLQEQALQREHAQWPLYVVAEKILSESEPLPPDWAVHGTTGYDFLAAANGIFVDQRNEKTFTRIYSRFTGNRTSLRELSFATKMMIMRDSLAGEITTLANELERIGEGNRHYRDFTRGGIRTALREVISALSIYRTYIDAHQGAQLYDAAELEQAQHIESHTASNYAENHDIEISDAALNGVEVNGVDENAAAGAVAKDDAAVTQAETRVVAPPVSPRDRQFIEAAVREAKRRHPLLDDTIFDYILDTLLLQNMGKFGKEDRARIAEWVMKFQQLTGPVMAKGVEDTAFYRYNRLVSLNEVGDHPSQFGLSVAEFHQEIIHRAALWPHAMLATSTHDNKRSEDVRARINVLSSLPDEWQAALRQWSRLNASKKQELDGEAAPDANDEYLFYQTLLGVWPLAPAELEQPMSPWGFLLQPGDSAPYQEFRQRVGQYMLKAAKEAKVYTSWVNPYEEYEEALLHFVDRVLHPTTRNRFLINLAPLARRVAYYGHFNALAQTLLKLTVPGVPDIYQGNELWDFSLVDPDNRRAVNYDLRRTYLKEIKAATKRKVKGKVRYAQELVQQWHDGRIKLFVTKHTLRFRRDHDDLFTNGAYIPLETTGAASQHLCAYLRQNAQGEQAIVVVPRLVATLTKQAERPPVGAEVWGDTAILLPADHAATSYENVFTGERITPAPRGKALALPVAAVLGNFPAALLAAGNA